MQTIQSSAKDRPAVICHILMSLNGKISGAFMGAPQTAPALKAYQDLRSQFGCTATLYGTTTMAEGYADGYAPVLPPAETVYNREDCLPALWADDLIVSVDPEGLLGWSKPVIARKGRAPAQVVEILTEQVPDSYLAYLHRVGIPYLFAGKNELDCALMLRKLRDLCSVSKLLLAGGGGINGSLLAAGCIDELSLVVAPVAEGDPKAVSLFETSPFAPDFTGAAFRLIEAKSGEGNALWLHYQAE